VGNLFLSLLLTAALGTVEIEPCGRDVFFLQRDQPWSASARYTVQVFRLSPPSVEAPAGGVDKIAEAPGEVLDGGALRVKLPAPLPPAASLRVVVLDPEGSPATKDFSTQPEATITHSPLDASPGRLLVSSATPLVATPDGLKLVAGARTYPVTAVRPLGEPACETPERRSAFKIDLPPGQEPKGELRLEGFSDVYGSALRATGKADAPKTPKGKEDAAAYVSLYFEDSAGSKPAFAADFKARRQFQPLGDWLFRPELSASIAKNLSQSSNSIRLAPLFSLTDLPRRGILVGSTFWFGPTLESDRDFDRVLGLATIRWEPALAYLYLPREKRQAILGTANPPLLGWGLEGWIGLEAGGSLSGQTMGDLEIDRYDILRLRPLAHGFVEVGRLTLDVSSTLRYLFADELSYEGSALRTVEGSRPHTEATLSWAFDPDKHLNLAVTYKNGSEPPLYREIDKFTVGIVAKY
jgi:hypothetical protein